ncbi:hypothetical protein EST38_g6500 [Candolleomyces aberdarensis]|uniref:FAD-binding domain-containing protein n=1 Tax=Candolleomyces aberdarensis TaxID=2316362 RepID=A0A4Q2DHQ6_9AGAR|nr:hypothetical protein EST38_g6500 [Candolleomyces aberdarensis]
MEKDVLKVGLKSAGIELILFETGETLGQHIWSEEVLRETRGEFIFSHLLHETAVSLGAKIRMGVTVTGIDPETRRVKLSSGEILTGDVIVGADGATGVSRRLLDMDDEEPVHRFNCYSTVTPKSIAMQDPELAPLFEPGVNRMFSWFGNNHAVLSFPMGVGEREAIAMYTYGPKDGKEGGWTDTVDVSGLKNYCSTAESRLQKLAALSPNPPACLPIMSFPELEDWVHDSGRLIVVGDAAHPIPAGAIQDAAMALEDGAVLAKLFSHLRTEDQIETLLYAFQDLRQPHCQKVSSKELHDINFMCMPPGEMQEGRDNVMRGKRDAGLNVLDASGDQEEQAEWAEIKDVFGYDAEDDADNWWMEWGLLRERARGTDVAGGHVQPVAVMQGVSQAYAP